MKNFIFIIMTILATMLFSCEKEVEKDSDFPPSIDNDDNKDFYYVKYEISGKSYFYIDGVSYNTEKGSLSESFSAARSFERTCGPVDKGFVARITLTGYRGAPASNAITISVSKNNGPFATKTLGQYNATYTINF